MHAPTMDSVVLQNTVPYQPKLWSYNGSQWVLVVDGAENHGGQGFNGLADYPGFTINAPGRYYAVSVVYRWYSPDGRLLNVEHYWAATIQLFRVSTTGSGKQSRARCRTARCRDEKAQRVRNRTRGPYLGPLVMSRSSPHCDGGLVRAAAVPVVPEVHVGLAKGRGAPPGSGR